MEEFDEIARINEAKWNQQASESGMYAEPLLDLDPAAIAAFVWALIVVWRVWRRRGN